MDEDVIRVLLDIPLWEIANLEQPSGTGDKKILREVSYGYFYVRLYSFFSLVLKQMNNKRHDHEDSKFM